MLSLLKYLKNCKKESILAPIFKQVEAFFELLVPIIMMKIIDIGIDTGNRIYIYKMGLLLLIFAVIGFISALFAQYYSAKAGVKFGTELRNDLFAHILNLSDNEIDKIGKNTLINRITNDTNQLQTGLNLFFRLVLRSPFIVIGSCILSFIINIKLSMIIITTIFIIYIFVYFIIKNNLNLYKSLQEKLDDILQITNENIAGVRVLRAFNKSESEIENFTEKNKNLYKEQKRLTYSSNSLMAIAYFIINLSVVLILYKSSFELEKSYITKGEVIALVNYTLGILAELLKSAYLVVIMTKSFASAKRVKEIFEISDSIKQGELIYNSKDISYTNILEFKNVYFKYASNSKYILENINFSLKKGESLGIIGGIGSGKTTLIKLILRFYDVVKGELLIKDKNIKKYKVESLRQGISLVEQKSVLFEGSIRDNFLFAREDITDDEIEKVLEFSMSKEIIETKEKGLEYKVESFGTNFSGGQKQRLSIARALLKDSDFLIFDDSSSALDYITDKKLRLNLKSLEKNIIIISQRIVSIKDLDKILVLDDGKIEGIGTHEQLLESSKVYREIYVSQFEESEFI